LEKSERLTMIAAPPATCGRRRRTPTATGYSSSPSQNRHIEADALKPNYL
jgi:hypothetical protein